MTVRQVTKQARRQISLLTSYSGAHAKYIQSIYDQINVYVATGNFYFITPSQKCKAMHGFV